MIDPVAIEERFHEVLEGLKSQPCGRIGLVRMVEFLEVLLETKNRELILQYAPTLVSRVASVLCEMEFADADTGVSDRLMPILWSLVMEYPEVTKSGICLAMLHRLTLLRRSVEAKTRIVHNN